MTKSTNPPESLWGTPPPKPRKMKGIYAEVDYAPPGQFGPKEAGSTLSSLATTQSIMIPTSFIIEQMADELNPALMPGMAFGSAWIGQMLLMLAMKIVASLMRNYGSSIVRDFGTWMWIHFISGMKDSLWEWLYGPKDKKRRRPRPKPLPEPDDEDRPRPFLDWLFPRRRRT